MELELAHLSPQEFFDRTKKHDFDAAFFGWLPEIADPDPFGLLHSSMIEAGSNYAGYSNPELDKLLEQGRSATDRKERVKLYHQVHRILHEDMPYTALYAPYGHYAWSRRIRGVNPADMSGQPRFPGPARWWIQDRPVKAKKTAASGGAP